MVAGSSVVPLTVAVVEVIALAHEFLGSIGLAGQITLELNTLGDAESRSAYRQRLVGYLAAAAG